MELVVRKNDLLRELQLFQGIVERKNTIPDPRERADGSGNGDEVRMLATDLEVGLRSRCAASVAKGGALTLPAKKLYEIIKALPETDVRIESSTARRQGGGRSVRLEDADAAARRLPDAARAGGHRGDASAGKPSRRWWRGRSSRSRARTPGTSSTARCSC
jgi:hypothetical protein